MRTKSSVIVIYEAGFNATYSSVEEAAKALGLSIASTYLYINSGKKCVEKGCFLDFLYTEADAAADLRERLLSKPVTAEEIFADLEKIDSEKVLSERKEQYLKVINKGLVQGLSADKIKRFFTLCIL